ncbi:MAG: diguanylate cyclase [Pseudomonadota bacterium]
MRQPERGEVRAEAVRLMASYERYSLPANAAGWTACLIASLFLPDPRLLYAFLALRLVAIAITRLNGMALRRRLNADKPFERELLRMKFGLAFAGATWGLLLLPIQIDVGTGIAGSAIVSLVAAGVMGVSLMVTPVPSAMVGFLGSCVLATLAPRLFLDLGNPMHPVAVFVPLMGIVALAFGTVRQQREAAEANLANRRLTAELSDTNARLEDALALAETLATLDPLTGLPNRRAFEADAARIQEEGEGQASLLLIDLDHFKLINDSHGHDAGDRTLVAVGHLLRSLASSDGRLACRLGGEEFALLCIGETADAIRLAETLRRDVKALSQTNGLGDFAVSASIGVAPWASDAALSDALKCADHAMYAAKRDGRNQVKLAA